MPANRNTFVDGFASAREAQAQADILNADRPMLTGEFHAHDDHGVHFTRFFSHRDSVAPDKSCTKCGRSTHTARKCPR